MLDVPVVEHISQLVVNLASRREADQGDAEDDGPASDDETEKKNVPITPESLVSNDSLLGERKPKRIRRMDQDERKRLRMYGAKTDLVKKEIQQIQQFQRTRVEPIFGGKDPFGVFELPRDSMTDLALHHYVNVFQESRMSPSPRQGWMQINVSDKTLLSVTTYCSASHFHFIRGIRAPQSCLPHKVNAIQNINNDLQRPGHIPSDYIILAVATMTLLECLAGEPKACAIHRKGLQLMVQARGGMQNLGFGGAVQRTISWVDTSCAILRRARPSLKPILTPDLGETEIPSLTDAGFITADLEERLFPQTNSEDLSQQIIYIWLRMRYLTEFLDYASKENPTAVDDCLFSDKIDFIERYTISLLHSYEVAKSEAPAFLTAFLNASLIYIYEELRDCPKWTNVCICLSQRIHSGMQMVNTSTIAEQCPDLLLWILLLGRSGNPPIGESGKLWFQKQISEMEDSMGNEVPDFAEGLKYFELAEKARPNRKYAQVHLSLKQRIVAAEEEEE